MRSSLWLGLALIVGGWIATASAQPWRYVDKRGQVHYTNNVNQLPPKLRKKVRALLEKKRIRRAAQLAAEQAAAPPSAAITSIGSIAIPAPATAQSAPSKPKGPTAHEKWQVKMAEANQTVIDLGQSLRDAETAAQKARQKALITPTGFNSADWKKADATVKGLRERLKAAEDMRVRVRKAEPPVKK